MLDASMGTVVFCRLHSDHYHPWVLGPEKRCSQKNFNSVPCLSRDKCFRGKAEEPEKLTAGAESTIFSTLHILGK